MSTITSADQILVLHAGKVAEAGTHQELLALKGRYANMWKKQIRAERAAEQAYQMVAKAKALKEAAENRPGSAGNEGSPDLSENEADNRSGTTLVIPSHASDTLGRAAETFRDVASSISGSEDNGGDDDKLGDVKDALNPSAPDPRGEGKPSGDKADDAEAPTGHL